MHTPVDERPHEDVGEEVLKDEGGDQLLLADEVLGVGAGVLQEVVHAEETGHHEVEQEAVKGRQALERGQALKTTYGY